MHDRDVFTQVLNGESEMLYPDKRKQHSHTFAHAVDNPRRVLSPWRMGCSRFRPLSILYFAVYQVYLPHWLVLLCVPASCPVAPCTVLRGGAFPQCLPRLG